MTHAKQNPVMQLNSKRQPILACTNKKKHGSRISLNENTKKNSDKLITLVIMVTALIHKFSRNLGANSKF
jgi:hypothetical protein